MADPSGVIAGMVMIGVLLTLAIGFGVRQGLDRARRDPAGLSRHDLHYFAWQDARRFLGSALMLLIAVGIAVGLSINPREDRQAGLIWGFTWLGVSLLVLILLVVALIDWAAIRGYACRHRRSLDVERQVMLAENPELADFMEESSDPPRETDS